MRIKNIPVLFLFVVFLASCSTVPANKSGSFVERIRNGYYPYKVKNSVSAGYYEEGIASWYGKDFHGKRTADGEIYNMYAYTAAHKTLPFNTYVRVENLKNGKETVVRINDRGPFVNGRIIDLTYSAARDLDMIGSGTAPVRITVLSDKDLGYRKKDAFLDSSLSEHMDENKDLPKYAVQLASFSILNNAIKYKDRISYRINGVYIRKSYVNANLFYRVLVGSFDSHLSAERFAKRVIEPVTDNYCISVIR